MADSRRLDPVPAADGAVRDSQVEALLVEGLECYFNGRYEDAIHVWTRVLFLDRSHARARAYIERAQAALAERQRRGEEMLQATQDLMDQGRTDAARRLLREVVSERGDDERASALRVKLERLERVRAAAPHGRPIQPHPAPIEDWEPRRRIWPFATLAGLVAAVGIAMAFASPRARTWLGLAGPSEGLATRTGPVALPVLSTSEVALVRARTLYSQGRLAQALQVLDRVGLESASRASADALRVEIQRLLLASAQQRASGGDHQ